MTRLQQSFQNNIKSQSINNSKLIVKPSEEEYLEHKKFLKEEMKKKLFLIIFFI